MATLPTPGTATTGPLADTLLNGYRDGINFLLGSSALDVAGVANPHPYVKAYLNGAFSLTAATGANVTLDTEVEEDSDSMHTGSNAYFTVNTAGVYEVKAQVGFPTTASGQDTVYIYYGSSVGGATAVAASTGPFYSSGHYGNCAVDQRCAVGDVLVLHGYSTSGGTLGTGVGNTWMSARWVRE